MHDGVIGTLAKKCSMLLPNCVVKRNRTLFLEVGNIYIPYSNV